MCRSCNRMQSGESTLPEINENRLKNVDPVQRGAMFAYPSASERSRLTLLQLLVLQQDMDMNRPVGRARIDSMPLNPAGRQSDPGHSEKGNINGDTRLFARRGR